MGSVDDPIMTTSLDEMARVVSRMLAAEEAAARSHMDLLAVTIGGMASNPPVDVYPPIG